jgi:hypothetical protein
MQTTRGWRGRATPPPAAAHSIGQRLMVTIIDGRHRWVTSVSQPPAARPYPCPAVEGMLLCVPAVRA